MPDYTSMVDKSKCPICGSYLCGQYAVEGELKICTACESEFNQAVAGDEKALSELKQNVTDSENMSVTEKMNFQTYIDSKTQATQKQTSAPFDIKTVLEGMELGEYANIFITQKLTTPDVLSALNEDDLEKIGISILGDRKKMMQLFAKLQVKKEQPPKQSYHATQPVSPQVIHVEQEPPKKSGGVWAVVGVLVAIVLIIIIVGSL